MTLTTKTILPLGALTLALAMPVAAAAQDEALVKKGQEVYAAQKCSVCHSIAGKGGKQSPLDGVGQEAQRRRHQGVDRHPDRNDEKDKFDEEAADAEQVGEGAGC